MTDGCESPRHDATSNPPPIQHPGEDAIERHPPPRGRVEPAALRTYTPSLAVLAKSAGCYHWTPEGRKLADFTSGVLVANLGHNPAPLVAARARTIWASMQAAGRGRFFCGRRR